MTVDRLVSRAKTLLRRQLLSQMLMARCRRDDCWFARSLRQTPVHSRPRVDETEDR